MPYKPSEKDIDLDLFAGSIVTSFKEGISRYKLGYPDLWIESGRYIVAESGILLTRVTTVNKVPRKPLIGIYAGLMI